MESKVLEIIYQTQQPQNEVRTVGEESFTQLTKTDQSGMATTLISLALRNDLDIGIRQACLLYLHRIIPRYWSLAFDKFEGPPISIEAKHFIRSRLLDLIIDQDTKIRNGAAYSLTSIATVDYPDEWPDLLEKLFSYLTSNSQYQITGSLAVLKELFDDCVTEELFFGGAGLGVMKQCASLLESSDTPTDIKKDAVVVFRNCIDYLQFSDSTLSSVIKDAVDESLPGIVKLFTQLLLSLTANNNNTKTAEQQALFTGFKYEVYITIHDIRSSFAKFLAPEFNKLIEATTLDIQFTTQIYSKISIEDTNNDDQFVAETKALIVEQLLFLGSVSGKLPPSLFSVDVQYSLLDSFITLASITKEDEESWSNDFNEFVTEETDLQPVYSIRSAINDFLEKLNYECQEELGSHLIKAVATSISNNNWRTKESLLFLFDGLLGGLENPILLNSKNDDLIHLLKILISYTKDSNEFVRARTLILSGHFLNNFRSRLNVKSFGSETFKEIVSTALNDTSLITKVLALRSIIYYAGSLEEAITNKIESQQAIANIVSSLISEAQEDTPSLLVESLSIAISFDSNTAASNPKLLELIFLSASNNPSNIQLVLETKEALEDLLLETDTQNYVTLCNNGLPPLISVLDSSENGEYTANINLALEILSVFVEHGPDPFPESVFTYIFPALSRLLLISSDDQILQVGAEAFDFLVRAAYQHVPQWKGNEGKSGLDVALEIASKLLSPDLSDSAAMNVGSLVTTIIDKFGTQLGNFTSVILEAATRRLTKVKEPLILEVCLLFFVWVFLLGVSNNIRFLEFG